MTTNKSSHDDIVRKLDETIQKTSLREHNANVNWVKAGNAPEISGKTPKEIIKNRLNRLKSLKP